MEARRKHSVATKRPRNHICAAQPRKEMPFFSAKISHSTLGAMEDDEHMSTKDRWLRKKYIGVWSLGSIQMRVIIPKGDKIDKDQSDKEDNLLMEMISEAQEKEFSHCSLILIFH